jgi:hypothetical protein
MRRTVAEARALLEHALPHLNEYWRDQYKNVLEQHETRAKEYASESVATREAEALSIRDNALHELSSSIRVKYCWDEMRPSLLSLTNGVGTVQLSLSRQLPALLGRPGHLAPRSCGNGRAHRGRPDRVVLRTPRTNATPEGGRAVGERRGLAAKSPEDRVPRPMGFGDTSSSPSELRRVWRARDLFPRIPTKED